MVAIDTTPTLRSILADRIADGHPAGRSKSPTGSRSRSQAKARAGQDDEFLKEAYRIVSCFLALHDDNVETLKTQHTHLSGLVALLQGIRKPYLSITEPPRRRQPRPIEEGVDGELKRWEGSKYLSERERDEIDTRGKLILRQCRERVGVLEDGEKGEFLRCGGLAATGSSPGSGAEGWRLKRCLKWFGV